MINLHAVKYFFLLRDPAVVPGGRGCFKRLVHFRRPALILRIRVIDMLLLRLVRKFCCTGSAKILRFLFEGYEAVVHFFDSAPKLQHGHPCINFRLCTIHVTW
jgi:hypothetical protein